MNHFRHEAGNPHVDGECRTVRSHSDNGEVIDGQRYRAARLGDEIDRAELHGLDRRVGAIFR